MHQSEVGHLHELHSCLGYRCKSGGKAHTNKYNSLIAINLRAQSSQSLLRNCVHMHVATSDIRCGPSLDKDVDKQHDRQSQGGKRRGWSVQHDIHLVVESDYDTWCPSFPINFEK